MRMVHTGVSRALGARLHQIVRNNLSNRFSALAAGVLVTMILQSSTATGLIVSSFARRGMIATATALAVMLGADVGTTIVAQILSFDIGWMAPLLLLLGTCLHHGVIGVSGRQWGRVAIGVGLILLALGMVASISAPLRASPILEQLFGVLENDRLLAVILMAGLTWLAHSSLAMVLLVMSLAVNAVVSVPMAITLVIGANLGGVLPPLIANWANGNQARRVPFGNVMFKLAGCVLLMPFIDPLAGLMQMINPDPARQVVNFHTFFNLMIAALFIPFVNPVANLVERWFANEPKSANEAEPKHLDYEHLAEPSIALASATLETVRMGQMVELMLRDGLLALEKRDKQLARKLIKQDDAVDSLYEAIKLYVTKASTERLEDLESQRATNILTFTTDLEHIGDILGHLMELNAKRITAGLEFSDEGFAEIRAVHARVADSLKLAIGVFISGDAKAAKKLLAEKRAVRRMEQAGARAHMERLRQQRAESISTSGLHMDILRDLKRIHSHIVAIAYPVLEKTKAG